MFFKVDLLMRLENKQQKQAIAILWDLRGLLVWSGWMQLCNSRSFLY